MIKVIDLNVEVGECHGAWAMGNAVALFPSLGSVNVACGFHAGDPRTIDATLAAAAPVTAVEPPAHS